MGRRVVGGAAAGRPPGSSTPDGAAAPAGGTPDGGTPAGGPALTIVVPAYNEATRLGPGMDRLQAAVDEGAVLPGATEVVVVDDGSTDGTAARAGELYARFPHARVVRLPANAGKGAAVRRGVAEARGRMVAFMDADMAIDPRHVPQMTAALDGAHVAIGSRALPGASAEDDTLGRTLMGWAFNRAVNVATGVSLGDTQCGFKAFRTPVARLLFHWSAVDRFAFDVEILATARRLGLRIAEVPVHWRNVPGSRIRPFHDARVMAGDLVRSRRGAATSRPVEVVALSPAPGAGDPVAVVRRSVDATTPVLRWPDGAAVALFPLAGPAVADRAADQLRELVTGQGTGTVQRRQAGLRELAGLAPLDVLAGNGPPAPGDGRR